MKQTLIKAVKDCLVLSLYSAGCAMVNLLAKWAQTTASKLSNKQKSTVIADSDESVTTTDAEVADQPSAEVALTPKKKRTRAKRVKK